MEKQCLADHRWDFRNFESLTLFVDSLEFVSLLYVRHEG